MVKNQVESKSHKVNNAECRVIMLGFKDSRNIIYFVGVRVPNVPRNLGLKVFMDAHMPVTHKEGDRYPLRPPSFALD
jgi:hypothetical protein